MNVRYCKNLLFLLLLILIVVSLSGCGNSNTKRFQEAVDDFCDAYTKYNSLQGIEYKSETDLINEDLSLRKMVREKDGVPMRLKITAADRQNFNYPPYC